MQNENSEDKDINKQNEETGTDSKHMENNENTEKNNKSSKEDTISNEEVKSSNVKDNKIEEMNKLIVNLKDQLLRTIAELQNVKKRHEIEKANISNFSITAFAKDVLSIRDNLCLALANCKDNSDAIVEGVKMTLKHLDKILDSYNIRIIVSLNKQFDPNYHQAMSEAVSDKDPGTIIQVMQEGFMIKDRLLRPALVVVAKSK